MKIFLTSTLTLLLLSGCADKTAFTKLNMNEEQGKAVEHTQSKRLMKNNEVGGMFSIIHLNKVYDLPDENTELFYISIFRKDTRQTLLVKYDNQEPFAVKQLSTPNKYSHLLGMNNQWIHNYLLSFKSSENDAANLSVDSGQFSSGQLSYVKDPQ